MLKEKTSSQGFGAPSSLLCRFLLHSSMNSAACGRELLVLVTALEWGKLRCRGLNLDGWILHFLTVVIWSKAAKVCREADLWEVPVVPMFSILFQGSFLLRMALMIPGSCNQRETSAWAHMAKPDCKLLLCLSCPQPCSGSSDQGLTWAKAEEHNSPSAQLPEAQQNRDGSRAETAELLPLICSSNGLPKTRASRSLSDHSPPVCSRFTSAQGSCREKWDRRTPAQQTLGVEDTDSAMCVTLPVPGPHQSLAILQMLNRNPQVFLECTFQCHFNQKELNLCALRHHSVMWG